MNGIRGSEKALFTVLCIVGLFAILSSTMSKNPVLKLFATSLEAPAELVGLIASASTIPGILISLPAASLSDIIGRRKLLLFSAFVFASAPFLYLFVTSWWQLIPIRFYHGFATAVFVPVAEAATAEMFPAKRGERISIFFSGCLNIVFVIKIGDVNCLNLLKSNLNYFVKYVPWLNRHVIEALIRPD